MRDSDLRSKTVKLKWPSIIIARAQDSPPPLEQVKATASLIVGSRLELIDTCGHLPCIEQPDDRVLPDC